MSAGTARGGREAILGAVRASLAATRGHLEEIARSAPHEPPSFVHPPEPDTVGQLERELVALSAITHRCNGLDEAAQALRRVLDGIGARTALVWRPDAIDWPGLDAVLARAGVACVEQRADDPRPRPAVLETIEKADVGITGVDLAIAESGTLVLASGEGRGRLASLLPPVHVAIVRQSRIVRGLGEALAILQARSGGDPLAARSSITLVTGPSRTADIEQVLTLGVHGPHTLHVIVVLDAATATQGG